MNPDPSPTKMSALLLTALVALPSSCATMESDRYRSLSVDLANETPPSKERADVDEARDEPFANVAALDRSELVREVLARNPSLRAAREAWRASLAEVRQASALDDPMLAYSIAPLSIPFVQNEAPFGQELMVSQMLPFPGRRDREGERALADAEMARADHRMARLELAMTAAMLHAEYVQNARMREVNDEFEQLVDAMRTSAEAQFSAGRGSLQDPLQAEVELARLAQDKARLASERAVLVARMNALLHRAPRAPLPAPPAASESEGTSVAAVAEERVDEIDKLTIAARPEILAARARIEGARAQVGASELRYFPDVSVNASYNSMWDHPQHQWMVGAGVNLPIFGARDAVAEGAASRLRVAEAEYERAVADVRADVEAARQRAVEARQLLKLTRERLLPAARGRATAARAAVESGSGAFFVLIEAEKELRDARLSEQLAISELERRLAELDVAVGRIPGEPSTTMSEEGERQ